MRNFDTDFYGQLTGSIRLTCSDFYEDKPLSLPDEN